MNNITRVKKGESIVSGKVLITCTVTIIGLWSHSGTGEEWADDDNGMTSADAQAFRRACSCFGLGRYFYDIPAIWVDLDQHRQPVRTPARTWPGLNSMRTEPVAAGERGIAIVHGSAFECRVLAETCSLLYLNPPYDSEFGPHSNKRMELVFLEHSYRWVTSEGVLVFVVPAPAVGTCARLLASQFDRLSIFGLEHL